MRVRLEHTLMGLLWLCAVSRSEDATAQPLLLAPIDQSPLEGPSMPTPVPDELLGPLSPDRAGTHDWAEGRPRWFASGIADLGFLYVRPRFTFGYGQPHYRWVGLDANPVLSGEGLGAYLGLRGALPYMDLRVGARGFVTFRRSFLCPPSGYRSPQACADQPTFASYDREGIENRTGQDSRYITLEAELTLALPLGPGTLLSELAGSAVTLVDEDFFVYEERIRIVVNPPWVWRARVGYLFPLEASHSIRIGLSTELLGVPKRDDMLVWRAGLIGSVRLYRDLEARGSFLPAIIARDTLGMAGGDTFLLGLRYRWASGMASQTAAP